MNYKLDFKNQRFAVVGIGETGQSIIDYLYYQNAKLVKVFDTREAPSQLSLVTAKVKDIPIHLGVLDYALFLDIDVIVISPGVSIYDEVLQLALNHGKAVIGDIELFALAIKDWNSHVIGITGSNGKTTVTALTGFLLEQLKMKVLVAGNIGNPVLTSYLEIIKSDQIPEVIILELSSFQLETTYNLKLSVATTLNISPDHLDRYRDLLQYAYAKANIFDNCKVQVLNQDDYLVQAMQRRGKQALWFGANCNQFTLSRDERGNTTHLEINNKKFMECAKLGLIGKHNYFNVLSSLALLYAIDIDIWQDQIRDALTQFNGLEHRMQKVTIHNDVLYIEDSKGTNVGAVIAGVSGLDRPVHLILGGDGKGQDFSPLKHLVKNKCKSVAIIGQDKALIAKALNGLELPIQEFATLPEAVKFCIGNAKCGDCVVLSPACASWDMFENYKQRAKVFIDSIYENIN